MSRPRYYWWGYIKAVIRQYPGLKDKEVSGVKLREKEAVRAAIEQTERMQNSLDRLKIIDLVLWKGTHDVPGAALLIPCSERTAQRYHADFIKAVAKAFGLMD